MERLIAEWREALLTVPNVGSETLDELESHLRETMDQLIRSGVNELEAFQRAVTQLGSPPAIASEFQKLHQSTWLPVKVVAGIGAAVALGIGTLVVVRFDDSRSSLLLAAHVFTVTLGYTTTLLIGGLGICFVCQRSFANFSPFRLQALSRVSFAFACVAACLTAVGIVLGMAWARIEWGRFWDWDPKETGGFCVIVWLICFLWAHRWRRATARGLLVMSILGNIIVSLGWFGANLFARVDSYEAPNYFPFVLAGVIANLTFFLIGLAPAGWLRLSKA